MEYIYGMTFAPFEGEGTFASKKSMESMRLMKECTNCNFVILVPGGRQKNAQSEEISYTSKATMTDDELIAMINYAKSLGLRVALKPTVNCDDGTWRAHINFFDEDVPCEPKWSKWFSSYTKFQLHYAQIAEKYGCEMFIAGCEMIMSERRELEWRKLIKDIRSVYSGLVSYNTDKYQEHNVKWWDAVDVISSSGYYPIDKMDEQLDRIEKVVLHYKKPFCFAEAGCMSVKGSKYVPNNWGIKGESDLEGQAEWYNTFFDKCSKRKWCNGMALWSWGSDLYKPEDCAFRKDYEVYAKPAEKVIREYYSKG